MSEKIEVTLDKEVYDRLMEMQVPPHQDINDVIGRLLHHAGRPSPESLDMESENRHRNYDEELEANDQGVYTSSGISP